MPWYACNAVSHEAAPKRVAIVSPMLSVLTLAPSAVLMDGVRTALQVRASPTSEFASEFALYSAPFEYRYGEVLSRFFSDNSQDNSSQLWDFPEDVVSRYASGARNMSITRLHLDVVRRDGSSITRVPASEVYNHHALVTTFAGDPRGSTVGSEIFDCRLPDETYEPPYQVTLDRPTSAMVFAHLISTRQPGVKFLGGASPLTECPCTASLTRRFNLTDDTIDGRACEHVLPGTLASYGGGSCCCVNGEFVTEAAPAEDAPRERAQLRLTIAYEDAASDARPLKSMMLCEFTRGEPLGEITIPQCAEGTAASDCTYTWEYEAIFASDDSTECEAAQEAARQRSDSSRGRATTQSLSSRHGPADAHRNSSPSFPGASPRELAYLKPHLHEGGRSITVQDALTNRTLCHASRGDGGVTYGRGRAPGDEAGYLTAMRACTWGPDTAPRLARLQPLRITAVYDARRVRYGVMAGITTRVHTPGGEDLQPSPRHPPHGHPHALRRV